MESVTKYFTFKSLKNIVLRQKFEKPSMFASGVNIQKNSPDDNFNHTLTREEKERILNLFAMIDISIPLTEKSSPLKGGVLIRAKSPYSMEKIIEKNKYIFY